MKYGISKQRKRPKDSFHNAISPILILCQFFGILPVSGITSQEVNNVKFNWKSFRIILSIFIIILGGCELLLAIRRIFKFGAELSTISSVIFYIFCELGLVLFFLLAYKWPKIIQIWTQTEEIFINSTYRTYSNIKLARKIWIVASVFILAAIVEHILYISSSLNKNTIMINTCNLTVDYWEFLFKTEREHIFDVIPFYKWMIPILEFLTISMTFCWSFVDIFVMLISIAINVRFEQIYQRIKAIQKKVMPNLFWIEVRSDFTALTDLLQFLDEQFSSIILSSCASNLFFICLQLFYSFREKLSIINAIYFWYSLIFVISRTMCTLFCAASIHDASTKPLSVLRHIPSVSWFSEAQRFSYQITSETIALSGKQFFYLTRKLILAMTGTVVTYELVLLDEIQELPQKINICP